MEMQPAIPWKRNGHIESSRLAYEPTACHCNGGRNAKPDKPPESAARHNFACVIDFPRAHQFHRLHGAHITRHDEENGDSEISTFKHKLENGQREQVGPGIERIAGVGVTFEPVRDDDKTTGNATDTLNKQGSVLSTASFDCRDKGGIYISPLDISFWGTWSAHVLSGCKEQCETSG